MNAKKLLSTLLSAAMAVSMLAGCFGGSNDFSREAAKAANKAQDTVEFSTDSRLTKSLLEALEENIQTYDVHDAMEADENLEVLLTSGYDLDIHAVTAEDAKAAAETIAQLVAKEDVSGKKSTGYISMVLNDNHYYYAAVLTYRTGNSGGANAGNDEVDNSPQTYTLTVIWNADQGTVKVNNIEYNNGKAEVNVKAGSKVTVQALPYTGFKVDDFSTDMAAIISENTLTIDPIIDNTLIGVFFGKAPIEVGEIKIDWSKSLEFQKKDWYGCHEKLDLVKTPLYITVSYKYDTKPDETVLVTPDMIEHVGYTTNLPDRKVNEYYEDDGNGNDYWAARFEIKYENVSTSFVVNINCEHKEYGNDSCKHCGCCIFWDGTGKTHHTADDV